MPKNLTYYAYVSRSKVLQLHDQLKDYSVEKRSVKRSTGVEGKADVSGMLGFFKAGLSGSGNSRVDIEDEGSETLVQKLRTVLDHIQQFEKILDLTELCRNKAGVVLDAFCYVYEGDFYVEAILSGKRTSININEKSINSKQDIVLSKDLLLKPGYAENSLQEIGPNNSDLSSDIAIICSH